MKLTVQACAECDRPTIPNRVYDSDPGLREQYVRRGAHGKCATCYNRDRAHARKPRSRPRSPRRCRDCDRPMLPRNQYDRIRTARVGYVAHCAHGLCRGCYSTARTYQTPPGEPVVRRGRRHNQAGTPCGSCDRPMISAYRYESIPGTHKRYVPHGGRGLCRTCYRRERRARLGASSPEPASQEVTA